MEDLEVIRRVPSIEKNVYVYALKRAPVFDRTTLFQRKIRLLKKMGGGGGGIGCQKCTPIVRITPTVCFQDR